MTAWETVHADAMTFLPTLDGLSDAVFDGTPVTRASLKQWAVVGTEGDEGSYLEQDYDTGPLIAETGAVSIRFVAWTGGTDFAASRATAFGWVDALKAHYAADKTLGVFLQGSEIKVGRVAIGQEQANNGAAVDLTVSVNYFARL